MKLTKRQEKQLNKVFDDPRKLRKWVDDVYNGIVTKCEEATNKRVLEYLDIYSISVAYTLRYVCGFGKKRLPTVMESIWNTMDSLKRGYVDLEDCIQELAENGVKFDTIIKKQENLKEGKYIVDK